MGSGIQKGFQFFMINLLELISSSNIETSKTENIRESGILEPTFLDSHPPAHTHAHLLLGIGVGTLE